MDSLKAIILCLLVISMDKGGGTTETYNKQLFDIKDVNCSETIECYPGQYEVSLSQVAISNFVESGRIACYKNRNGQIRHYVCFQCSVCEQLSVLIECGRKHDTICSNNCTNPEYVYDKILKTCISTVTQLLTTASVHHNHSVYVIKTDGQFIQTSSVQPFTNETTNTNPGHGIKWPLIIIILGVVNVNVVVICTLVIRKRRRRTSSDNCHHDVPSTIATLKNETTVSVVSENNNQTTSDNRTIGVVMSCDMSLGSRPTPPASNTVITSQKKTSTYDPFWLEMKAILGPEGGIISDSRSSVSLIIPPGAIPETRQAQEIIVRVGLKPSMFGLYQENDRILLSPVVECLSPGLIEFNSCVTLVVPHRAKLDPDWKFHVLHSEDKYSDPVSKFQWTVTDYKPNETQGIHFEIDDSFFRIKTTHFTTFACSGTCKRKVPLSLEVVVYGDYVHMDGRQRVDLRCYVCDTIKDYSQKFKEYEPNRPLCVPRAIEHFLSKKKTNQITIQLPENEFGKDWPWMLETFYGSLPNSRVIDVNHIARCCSEAMPYYVQFTLKPKQEDVPLNFLEATLKVIANTSTEVIGPVRIMTTNTGQNHPSRQVYPDIVSSEKLRDVARDIPVTKWKDVYRTLHGLSNSRRHSDTDIENIEYDCRGEVGEMKYKALKMWHATAGTQATTVALTQALKNCELNSVIYAHFRVETDI